jgi:hypothetical protein
MEIGIIEGNPQDSSRRANAPTISPATPETERRAADQLDEIRQYLRDQYARRDVVARTTTPSGQEIDWIPVESQEGWSEVAEPPETDPDERSSDPDRVAHPVPSDLGQEAESAPAGTVPVVRRPIELMRPVGDLQDWLAKGPRKKRSTPPDDTMESPAADAAPVHKYAHAIQTVPCFGAEGTINTWKPYVQWSNEFSLGQLWLANNSSAGRQTIEVGAQTFKDQNHDWEPHLFIFFTTNGYGQSGDNLGGYNTDVKGWVQISQTVRPLMLLPGSQAGGDQYDLSLKVQLWAGNWWIRVGNEWMGYYPGSLYSPTGLQSQSDGVDWGGEIVDDSANHPEPTATWMGSGHSPAEGWQHAAYMRNLSYQSDPAGSLAPLQGFPLVTNPLSYNIATDFSGASNWGSNFYWGGPGGL